MVILRIFFENIPSPEKRNSKGSIKEGKRADLVILDKSPFNVNIMEIKDIRVLETIKDGKVMYKNPLAV